MNLIKQHAQEFVTLTDLDDNEKFISSVRSKIHNYKRTAFKVEFLQHLLTLVKFEYDKHIKDCPYKGAGNCPKNYELESIMFFLNEEISHLNGDIDLNDFNIIQKENLSDALNKILESLNRLEIGQQITFEDLSNEMLQMKDYLYLPKKTWMGLAIGKLTEMVAAGIVSESLSKEIVNAISNNYSEIVKNL